MPLGFPCKLCGVRADLPCKHREAEPTIIRPDAEPPKKIDRTGMGYNFGTRKRPKRNGL